METVWLVFNVDYFEPVAGYLDEASAEQAAVDEHNRLYGHNGPDSIVDTYEELRDSDSNVMVIGPAPLKV